MRNRVRLLLVLALASACGRTAEPVREAAPPPTAPVAAVTSVSSPSVSSPSASSPNAKSECDAIFEAPPDAEELCNEHVRGQKAEIHFRSYGTSEARVDVNRRYQGPAGRCHFGVVTKPPIFSVAKDNLRLSTHEASETGFPTCANAPKPTHKTVIVISSKTDF